MAVSLLRSQEMVLPTTPGDSAALEREKTMELLDVVHADAEISQRSLAAQLGIAVGLANSYVKRCVAKGLIKVREAPARRFAYYVTPQGFAEKSRLTIEYLSSSFDFFRLARRDCEDAIHEAHRRGWSRAALYGAGELCEVAVVSGLDSDLDLVCVADLGRNSERFAGLPVVSINKMLQDADGVIVTDIKSPQKSYDLLVARFGESRVIAPAILRARLKTAAPADSEH